MGLSDGSGKRKREVDRAIYGNSADGSLRKPRSGNRSGGRNRDGGSGRRGDSNGRVPSDNGSVNGRSAYIKQDGERIEAYEGPDQVGKIVTNDGLNAAFVRDDTGRVIVDESKNNPYEPYQHRKYP